MARHPDAAAGRRALLVAGMHRSGTSALALALGDLGWSAGRDLLETQVDVNREGFGENRAVVDFNERLLAGFDRRWYQFFSLQSDWCQSEAAAVRVDEAAKLLDQQFGDSDQWLLKDPRLCLTLPLWRRALAARQTDCLVVLMLRHPESVARSLKRRDGLPLSAGFLLWAQYLLAAERASRGLPRAVIHYEDLIARGADALRALPGIVVPDGHEVALDPTLDHSGADAFGTASAATRLCERIMDALSLLEREDSDARLDALAAELTVLQSAGIEALVADDLLEAVVCAAGEVVRIGERHSHALEVIASKDDEIRRVAAYAQQCERTIAEIQTQADECAAYARQCEATIRSKDQEIAEVGAYATHCETTIQSKDAEIAEVGAYARRCEATIAERDRELAQLRAQRWYRLLKRLRLLR